MITKISIKKFEHSRDIELPRYATEQSAGLDLCAAINQEIVIAPGQIEIVSTGIAIALPKNTEAQIRPRSGLAAAHGITVLNTPGTIDADYRGEIKVILINHGKNNFVVTRGMRIAQMVIAPYIQADLIEVNSLEETVRGIGGFGSTGH